MNQLSVLLDVLVVLRTSFKTLVTQVNVVGLQSHVASLFAFVSTIKHFEEPFNCCF